MAESIIYEDTPFAEYLAEIGSEEELTKQPELFELERQFSQNNDVQTTFFTRLTYDTIEYLKEAFSTALPIQEENQFEERFKYLLCTSHLLNDTLSIYFYDSKKPSSAEIREAGLYAGGLSRRNFEVLFSAVIGLTIVFLTWLIHDVEAKDFRTTMIRLPAAFLLAMFASFFLYRRMRRKAVKTLYNSALHYMEALVYNCQNLDLKINKALIMIQEIELVSRGYRLSMPLSPVSRIEQNSNNRRCLALRETVYNILQEAFLTYRNAIVVMKPEISNHNLNIMYNMYNIVPCNEDDEWIMEENDTHSLENLKLCFQKMHTKRRECLCHFLALDVMTPGRDSHRRDYESHWAAVNNHLNNLSVVTGLFLDRVIVASASELYTIPSSKQDFMSQPSPAIITNKKLKSYLHRLACIEQHIRGIQAKLYICNEDARKFYEAEGVPGENEKETLVNQYESISKDFTYIFQEWEEGKKVLKEMMEPTPKDPDSIGSRQSLVEDIELPKNENEPIENSSEKPLIDWTQTDEPLDVPAQVFEAEAEPEVITKKLTREERIAIQKAKRTQEAKVRSTRQDSERMVHELKDVLVRRKPMNYESEVLKSSSEEPRIQLHGSRVVVATN
ncbi:Mysoin-binding motif of peroxisomes-domain-containing protein [Glomus cerebriforme]|uniref:Vezatin n=1 Tax=Glomus cerebriforme TaxID=658196 RepID=A0A397TLU3_9GLOM|nr:Mysoin-binding motif of peroxisomes-domain-containing protein [Glomus cerebriforme]